MKRKMWDLTHVCVKGGRRTFPIFHSYLVTAAFHTTEIERLGFRGIKKPLWKYPCGWWGLVWPVQFSPHPAVQGCAVDLPLPRVLTHLKHLLQENTGKLCHGLRFFKSCFLSTSSLSPQGLWGPANTTSSFFFSLFFLSLLVSESLHQVWDRNCRRPETSPVVVQDLQWAERGKTQLWGRWGSAASTCPPQICAGPVWALPCALEGRKWDLGSLAGGQAGSKHTHSGDNFVLWGGEGEKAHLELAFVGFFSSSDHKEIVPLHPFPPPHSVANKFA